MKFIYRMKLHDSIESCMVHLHKHPRKKLLKSKFFSLSFNSSLFCRHPDIQFQYSTGRLDLLHVFLVSKNNALLIGLINYKLFLKSDLCFFAKNLNEKLQRRLIFSYSVFQPYLLQRLSKSLQAFGDEKFEREM